jgi:diguanylate cyclase (GGDEF)-like protein
MLRKIFIRLGYFWASILLCLTTVVMSLTITLVVSLVVDGETPTATGWAIATLAPAVISAIFTFSFLRMLFHLYSIEDELRRLSITDDLTQAYNRRYFFEWAEKEVARSQRYGTTFSLIIFDVDDFKKVNDHFGHTTGDLVLRGISETCIRASRQADIFARYGGEEFVFLLPDTDQQKAIAFAERIRRLLAGSRFQSPRGEITVTVSLGVKTYDGVSADLGEMLVQADDALYTAKRLGKNRVILADSAPIDNSF